MQITDQFLRKINYLRVSVTDRCDLRCVYCMKEKMNFLPKNEVLSLEEIERLCDNFIDLGVEKIRLTGGEPLVRKDIIHLIKNLNKKKSISNLKEITLTTNGSLLKKFAKELKHNGINRINVSLDSLNPEKYKEITKWGKLEKVINGIQSAINEGIKVKINTVLTQDFNDEEIFEIIDWCKKNSCDISLIEIMPIGSIGEKRFDQYLSMKSFEEKLVKKLDLNPSKYRTNGPSRYLAIQIMIKKLVLYLPFLIIFVIPAIELGLLVLGSCTCV